jgi:hypothetical protein
MYKMKKLILLTSVAILAINISECLAVNCESGKKVCGSGCIAESMECKSCGESCYYTQTTDGAVTLYGSGEVASLSVYERKEVGGVKGYYSGDTADTKHPFFGNSDITSVSFDSSSNFTSIGQYAFYNATGLTSITLPEGVTSIGKYAFGNNNNLTELTLPEGLKSIGDGAFRGNNLTELTLPEGLESIGQGAFMIYPPDGNTHLNTLIIPDSVTSIGESAFQGMGLSTVILPDSITSIADEAFGSDDSNDPIDNLKIICKGNSESCEKIKNFLQDICVNISGSGDDRRCDRSLNLANNVNLANESQCNSANYYWDGRTCNYEPDADSRVCDHEISGYVKVGDYCASPENTYAKKHYTPAEAAKWLHDGNDNFVVLTFKK